MDNEQSERVRLLTRVVVGSSASQNDVARTGK